MRMTWRSELPSWLLLGGMLFLAAITWPAAPERIPSHWNGAGEVDRYGGKLEGLLLLPALSLGVYLLFLALPRVDPGRANYERFAGAYSVIKIATIVVLAVLYGILHVALRGHPVNMSIVTALIAGGAFIVLGDVMGKTRPNWFVGIRTPWTLSSKMSWSKTHRVGGWLLIVAGLGLLLIGLVRPEWGPGAILMASIALVVWAFVYSYLIWRHDPDRVPPAGTLPSDSPGA
jgi:uncharacterized membrane protein